MKPEEILPGGNVSGEVVRVGATVRKRATPATPAVEALLGYTAAGFTPPPGAQWGAVLPPDRRDLICHHDPAPRNLVCDGDRWVFIDWDLAGPGSRLWDLAWAAIGFVPLAPGGDPAADGPRLRALADGYRLRARPRADLPALLAARARSMYDLLRRSARTGEEPWAGLYAAGHGEHWGPAADYIDRHLAEWSRALTR